MRRLLIAALAVLTSHAALAEDVPAQLKPGTGDDVAGAACNACHTSDYIVMNSMFLTGDQWKAEVTKMRKAFGAPIDDEMATVISAYLAANYAVGAKP
jgi:sulfite dehydrogenase (cytochrome) subunit B